MHTVNCTLCGLYTQQTPIMYYYNTVLHKLGPWHVALLLVCIISCDYIKTVGSFVDFSICSCY